MPLLPKDAKQQRLALIAAVPLILAAGYWNFVHKSRVAEIDDLQDKYDQLDGKNQTARRIAAQGGPELKKKLALYEQHVRRLEELIPRSEEVPDLLHDITVRAVESGVELNLMRPEKSVPTEFYTRQIYSMSVFGPYDGVGRFLSAVGSLPRIVTAERLKVVPRIDLDRSGARRVQAEFQIETFVVPEAGKSAIDAASPVKEKPGNART